MSYGTATPPQTENFDIDPENIQGLLASGYGSLPCGRIVFLKLDDDVTKAKGRLGAIVNDITTAAVEHAKKEIKFNLAFTAAGLAKLAPEVIQGFSRPFREGIGQNHRLRLLGQKEENPGWHWGGPKRGGPDLIALIYAGSEQEVCEEVNRLVDGKEGITRMNGMKELPANRLDGGREHFGFKDGIGQPAIRGFDHQIRNHLKINGKADVLDPGEFILGYTNGFGTISEESNKLGKNGSYLVFLQIEQDVDAFDRYFAGEADRVGYPATYLKSKAVGRWQSGAPLAMSPREDDPALANADDFSYARQDPHGHGAPIGCHIRRANPRDSFEGDEQAVLARTQRRRLLRRGRAYGPDESGQRGLNFICLCADIERQFEFVSQSWLNNPAFEELTGEVDPLVGPKRYDGCPFSIQRDPVRLRLRGMPAFTTIRGGGYFFLPSISALHELSGKRSAGKKRNPVSGLGTGMRY